MVILRGRDSGAPRSGGGGGGNRKSRRSEVEEEDDDGGGGGGGGGGKIVCTGKACRSCTAGVIADCIAVCCCPCAVVDILVLALFKVPWTLGRKCLGLQRKKRSGGGGGDRRICNNNERCCSYRSSDGIPRIGSAEDGALEIESSVFGSGGVVKDNFSARFDAEEVWLELYQVGHLGFGRVSFTEIPSQCKGT